MTTGFHDMEVRGMGEILIKGGREVSGNEKMKLMNTDHWSKKSLAVEGELGLELKDMSKVNGEGFGKGD
jgi:hypothetical protein